MVAMGKELIQLSDQLEQHGLVDYQMGIWEEEILSGRCSIFIYSPGFGYCDCARHTPPLDIPVEHPKSTPY